MPNRCGRRTRATAVPAALLAAALAGCGGGKADVSGKVFYMGKPLATGTVSMVGPDGVVRQGTIGRDGTYHVTGVAAGKVQVGVLSLNPAGDGLSPRRPGAGNRVAAAPSASSPDNAPWFAIPAKYQEPTTSGLTVVVASGTNRHDIKLE